LIEYFWATVCKNASPYAIGPLSVCLSVTLVYYGQTVGWIKTKLGMEVGLVPGHIVLDGDPAPLPKRGTAPRNFRSMSVLGCLFVVFFITPFLFFTSVRQIKMAIGQVLGARTVYRIVSYCIVSYHAVFATKCT